MLRRLLHSLFVEDAPLKALSLVLAVVLFVAVRGDKDAATSAYAEVSYGLPADRVLVSDPVDEVRLGIRGPWTRVSRLDEREIEPIRVDLSDAHDGDLSFTEDMVHLPAGLRLASITPPSVKLRFEPRLVRRVPVQPILEGEPAHDWRVVRAVAEPSEVTVVGAKSVVEAIQRARTRPLRISEARGSIDGEVALEPLPRHARWEAGSVVRVHVEMAPELAERRLADVPIVVTGAHRLDARAEPEAAEVVLRGPADALARVSPGSPSLLVDAAAEDSHPPGASRKRISVAGLPPGVAAEVRPESVTLITRRRRE